ncbi:hypothetical protein LQF59_06985 [Tetragenococcus koreensis]|uniref:hypothetical protein n=1 Tax=Tetragenococcus koreensis TaxID=290335 RepID=UPI001F25B5E8|nr:hypothetical protein [Tetragenococcus koreensis]MCF1614806.1 hypothetical protein [Tetragenococcus koreensis]MCF1624630.1 hypothetical protein [Tetragenococcus koreensis]
MERKAISVVLAPKAGGKEIEFSSLNKAGKYLGISRMQISRILKRKRTNNTAYFITSDQ